MFSEQSSKDPVYASAKRFLERPSRVYNMTRLQIDESETTTLYNLFFYQ